MIPNFQNISLIPIMFLVKEFHHLKIQLEDIISATDKFGPSKIIGRGGFGSVYKGEISHPEGRRTVAFKRLDRKFGQGNTEFWKEIMMLSKLKHENLISLLHFCVEGDERILVYEYASRGSLDRYLSDDSLTWIQRLKICVQAARGISYLHDPKKTHQRVLHRDIKSSNILLDENWTAKVSDFGLSKIGLANQPQTYLVSNPVGTIGYCDPLYYETGFLSKESDVYSFGVVLFEVMCGKLCCEYSNNQLVGVLVRTWKESFVKKKLDDIIFDALQGQIKEDCLNTFSTIAYRCLNGDHTERPMMVEIVNELEVAFEQQLQLKSPSLSIPEQVKSKKRGHDVNNSDPVKRERLSKRMEAERAFNDSNGDEDRAVELQEPRRLRDRGMIKKIHGERDLYQGNVGGIQMLPPPPTNVSTAPAGMTNNHHSHSPHPRQLHNPKIFPSSANKVFRAAPPLFKDADEMIGVAVPRKARSASRKRSHEWIPGVVMGGGEEQSQFTDSPQLHL